MNIVIFIIVLGILIFVHELGHFIFAKKTGMLVEEFALGFPPRIFSFKKGETKYSLGLIPIGGFVKILGEEYDEESAQLEETKPAFVQAKEDKRFTNRPKWAQAIVLVAGVSFNFLLAWILLSIGFMSGLPVAVDQFEADVISNSKLTLLDVLAGSPAEQAGLKVGDSISSLETITDLVQGSEGPEAVENFIVSHGGQEIGVLYSRGGEANSVKLVPKAGVVEGKPAIGVSFTMVGVVKFNFFRAFWEGIKYTISLTVATAVGLAIFVKSLITGNADLSQISGPVGIVSLVGDAFSFGFVYLLSFIAIISINLAVINLIPVPALDGGRLLFVLIEKIKGSSIKANVANRLNLIGFALLILLMILVTFSDVAKFF